MTAAITMARQMIWFDCMGVPKGGVPKGVSPGRCPQGGVPEGVLAFATGVWLWSVFFVLKRTKTLAENLKENNDFDRGVAFATRVARTKPLA